MTEPLPLPLPVPARVRLALRKSALGTLAAMPGSLREITRVALAPPRAWSIATVKLRLPRIGGSNA